MAKKQTKQVPAASPVLAFIASMIALCTDGASAAAAYSEANKSRSATVVALIADLWAAFKGDAKAYAAAVEDALGNGQKGKAHIAGKVSASLKEAKIDSLVVRTMLSHARTVANNYGNPAVRKAASESGLRAGYDAAKPAKVESAATTAAAAPKIGFAEMMVAELSRVGVAGVLAVLESALVAGRDTIRAGIVHESRVKAA